jgi:hypothetical protein
MQRIVRCLSFMALAGVLCLAQSALAADAVAGASDAGYGRLLFTLAPNDQVTAQVTGSVLAISFGRKVSFTPDAVVQSLPGYISGGRADADGKTFRFAMNQPARIHTSAAAGKFAVDLMPQGYAGTPPDLPKPPPPRTGPVDVSKLPVLKVRSGAYHNFTRLVFDWPRNVDYTVFPGAGKLTVRFEAQANLDFSALDREAPPWVKAAGWHIADKGMVVDLAIDAASGYHDFRDGTHVVVDVLAPKTDADAYNPPGDAKPSITTLTPQQARSAKPTPAAPTAKVAAATPSATGAPAKLTTPSASSGPAKPAIPTAATPTATATPAPSPEATPDSQQQAATNPDAAPTQAADGKLTRDGAVLIFPGAGRHPMAVFTRGLNAWILLEEAQPLDVVKLKTQLGTFPAAVEATSGAGLTQLRITLRQPEAIAAFAEGSTLKVVIAPHVNPTAIALGFARNQENPTHSTISTLLPGVKNVEKIIDPLAGDELTVIPALPGRIVASERDYIEFSALPTAAGMVLLPYVDDLAVSIDATRVTITRPGGLSLTPPQMPYDSPEALSNSATSPSFLDFAHWRKITGGTFLATERRLRAAAARLAPAAANKARLTMARFYLANDFAAEALGLIDFIQSTDPGLQSDVQLQTMRSAASLQMGRYRDAANALAGAQFDNDRHAALWRGLAQAALENWDAASTNLERAAPVLAAYQPDIQIRVRLATAEAALAVGRLEVADAAIQLLPKHIAGKLAVQAALDRARLYAGERRRSRANRLFAEVQLSGYDDLSAQALYYRISSDLSAGVLKPDKAINALERLRFRWRGDLLELKTLRKLASIYFQQKRWRDGLLTLRIATQNFPNEDWSMQAQDDMRTAFVNLFLKGQADAMPPVEALGLFYDFIDLTPIGSDGDEMIRHMADRLVKVDLLGPAADLLNWQITKRLDGVARAQVATRLAMVQLMDHKPQAVLDTLRSTEISTMPDEVAHQRLLMEARAMAELKEWNQALDLIAVDQQPDTVKLRAEICWQSGNWPLAAQKTEELLGDRWQNGPALSDEERQLVMRAAVAYSMANDETSLDRLRQHFTARMANTPDANAFAVVTQRIDLQGIAFRDAAAKVASIDTLKSFMKDLQGRPIAN